MTRAQRRWRVALIVVGVGLLLLGGIVLLNDVAPKRYIGILAWLAGAIIIHDGIIAPAVFGVSLAMRRAGRRIPLPVILIVQGAIVVGAIMALLVFPEIAKQAIGSANPSILPLDYTGNLIGFYIALAVSTAVAIGIYLVVTRRQNARPSTSQD